MPIRRPSLSNSPPPLFPSLIAVSTRSRREETTVTLSLAFIEIYSESTETIPLVAEIPMPTGFPMAMAVSPTVIKFESATETGSAELFFRTSLPVIFSTATS